MQTLMEKIEDVSLKAMMGIDLDKMEVSNLLMEAEAEGLCTEDFEKLIFEDKGKAIDLEDLIARIECAGYRVAKEESEDEVGLVLTEEIIGVILH